MFALAVGASLPVAVLVVAAEAEGPVFEPLIAVVVVGVASLVK